MTVEDFLAWDGDGHQGKLELVDGEVRAMSPASTTHGTLQLTVGSLIRQHLKAAGSPCRALVEPAVSVRVRSRTNLHHPPVQEVVFVRSTRVRAAVLRRTEAGAWPENAEVIEKGGHLLLGSFGFAAPLADIYADTYLANT